MKISVISPIYLGEKMLHELVSRVTINVSLVCDQFEIILVEDGSPDNSWDVIQSICATNKNVKGVKLSRNFGQHYAITAGLMRATGDWIVVMDCDLQDRPEEIPGIYAKTREGYDIVLARRKIRLDGFFKRLSSKLFYRIFGYLTDSKQDASIANFGIYHRRVIQSILSMKDHVRYFPTMVQWVGFSQAKVDVQHANREEGKSSYSLRKLLKLAFDNIISFSDKPLKLMVNLGISISLFSFIIGLYFLYKYFKGDIIVLGYSSLIISVWFLSGLMIFMLGIIGIYLGKTFEKVKDRPTYIIDKELNL